MSDLDTSREAVERLRRHMGDGPVTDTLRALVSERDAARAEVARLREAILDQEPHDAGLVPMRLRLLARSFAEPTP